ncbi:M23 family metallopeptidase [Algoriphagus aestuariicola]|uniref:M23 family metallopeptidase n=1 Tax=Algoriphagus aestuariicola TaxID=1852016 RepID=A0ABS3BKB5_9BACT|nr:M23 family metallopeptidase [Algoriphagus aestuariicola]MBN7799432.1 M23 family metallopeptidase [Algoriphagus aestuariicola]
MKRFPLILLIFGVVAIVCHSCNQQSVRIFKSNSVRVQYMNTLESAGLIETKVGRTWQESGSAAIAEAPIVELPLAIQGSFKAKSLEARAWRINLAQGATVNITVHWKARDSSSLIVDFLAGPEWKEVDSFTARNDSLTFEADRSGNYLLRIQPELLGEGNFLVRIQGVPTYAVFPVQGKDSKSVQSFWGDSRDGGRRSHEGVDIFASRGTPVLAPVKGVVTTVRDQGLGGKQVWVRDNERNWHLYFAHLDSQMVRGQQRVTAGDTLGFVGNTGNARTTAPHLHFAIYHRGAIDPLPAITDQFDPAPLLTHRDFSQVMLLDVSSGNLRSAPSTGSEIRAKLSKNQAVFVLAATDGWYQIRTPDGLAGFLSIDLLREADSTSMPSISATALTSLYPSIQDSLTVQLDDFVRLGTSADYDIIQDQDENILYLPRNSSDRK